MSADEHNRAPLLWLLIPYVGGLVVSASGSGAPPVKAATVLALLLGCIAFAAASRHGPARFSVWALCIGSAAFLGGTVRMGESTHTPERWSSLPPRELSLEVEVTRIFSTTPERPSPSILGRIVSAPPVAADLIGQRVFASRIELPAGEHVIRSKHLLIKGVIESLTLEPAPIPKQRPAPVQLDSFRNYLHSSGVFFRMSRNSVLAITRAPPWHETRLHEVRAWLQAQLSRGLPRDHPATRAHLAMLLGLKSELSEAQKQDYLHSGTMHLFAISGLHIAVIAACIHNLLSIGRLGRRPVAILGIIALTVFVEATGGTPSARRALLMVALIWIGGAIKRPANPLAAWATAALAVLLIDPLALFSVSFQFSYAVVGALLLYGSPLERRLLARWKPWHHLPDDDWRWWHRASFHGVRRMITVAATSWTATLVSTPLSIGYFSLATPGGLITNFAVIPMSIYSITAGVFSILSGLLHAPWLSIVFNHAAALILLVMNACVHAAARVPGMFFEGTFANSSVAPVFVSILMAVCAIGYGLGWSRVPGRFLTPAALSVAALVFLVTPGTVGEESTSMKSAYELAMERLRKNDAEPARQLSEEQKARLAEIDRVYHGKIAEREIFLNQRLVESRGRGELEEAGKIQQQIVQERARLEEDRESEKERVRRQTT